MTLLRKLCLTLAGGSAVLLLLGLLTSSPTLWRNSAVVGVLCAAVGIGSIPTLARYQFTAWILAAVVSALVYPEFFLTLGPYEFAGVYFPEIDLQNNKRLVLVVVQSVMFGMGTKMSLRDFAGIAKMPFPIFIGVGLQFLVMPLSGYVLAKLFQLPPEIAAGAVLIGSCSSGLASNVMCYLARADLPLSITLTSVATLLAPVATPFWMKQLAGEMIEVDAWEMMMQILEIVIVPIGAALVHDCLRNIPDRKKFVVTLLLYCLACSAFAAGSHIFPNNETCRNLIRLFSVGLFFAIVYHHVTVQISAIDRNMQYVSMAGIIYFTVVTTAAGRENLLVCGVALLAVALLHNLAGYSLGYVLSRLAGLDRQKALTVGFEVGMQNGGMASGLALLMGKAATVGLAAAVFSPLMNVTGSILANQIRRRKL